MKARVLALLCLLPAGSGWSQSMVYSKGAENHARPVAVHFRLPDLSGLQNSRDELQATVGAPDESTVQPRLTISDSSGSTLTMELDENALRGIPHECRVGGTAALWFSDNKHGRQLWYFRSDSTLEWEIFLDSVPETNWFSYRLRLHNLVAFYQPELTYREVLDGHERADSVVGSYAIYRTSGGKFLHLYRPRAIDADGNATWCEMTLDSLLSIVVPPQFLARAVYPVRIDPTFGYTSAGASSLAAATIRCYGNRAAANRHTAGANERVDSFRVHFRTLSGNNDTLDIAAYSWNNGLQDRLDTAVWLVTSSATAAWVSSGQVAQWLTSGSGYTLAINHHEGAPRISYDIGYGGDHGFDNVDNLPVTWTEDGTGTYLISMYACYSVVSGSGLPIVRRRHL